jgi:hypothetical protein
MKKNILPFSAFILITVMLSVTRVAAKESRVMVLSRNIETCSYSFSSRDSVPPSEVMDIIEAAINSLNSFNIDIVANIYTQNAVVADDEPPYSWNGPTAGVQWVNAVEQVCKDNKLTKLRGSIGNITVFQHSAENFYIVVPVIFTGNLPQKQKFTADGAFTFILRMVSGKWMIKSQVWMPRRGM